MAFELNAQQLAALRKAVKSYNSAIDRMAKSGKYDVIPTKTNMFREKEFISDKTDFNLRVKQLRRILTTEKKGAQDAVDFHGYVMPRYMRDEIKNIVRSSNERRKAIRSELFPNFDELTPLQKANVTSNKNLMPLDEADYSTPEDFDDLLQEEYPNIPMKAEIYIDEWNKNRGNPEVPKLIREIAQGDPFGFQRLMEGPDIEKEIEYIYSDDLTASGQNKSRGSAFKEPMINRYAKAEAYWREQYEDYKAHRGYFR